MIPVWRIYDASGNLVDTVLESEAHYQQLLRHARHMFGVAYVVPDLVED
jgi:hypothetical protein